MERGYMLGLLCVFVCLFWDLPTASGLLNTEKCFGRRRCNETGTDYCTDYLKAHLVKIESQAENEFIVGQLSGSSIDTFWNGLMYDLTTEKFLWRDREENTVAFWGPDMPLTGFHKGCVAYLYDPGIDFYWDWYATADCTRSKRSFICERADRRFECQTGQLLARKMRSRV